MIMSAAIIHNGEVIHHQDQETAPVILKMRNTRNKATGEKIPITVEFTLSFIGYILSWSSIGKGISSSSSFSGSSRKSKSEGATFLLAA